MFGIGDAINFGTSFVSDIFGGGDDDLLGFGTELLGGLISGGAAGYGAYMDAKTARDIARENREFTREMARENREEIRKNYRTAPYYNRPAPTDGAGTAPVEPQAGTQPMTTASSAGSTTSMPSMAAGRGGLAGRKDKKTRYVRNPATGAIMPVAA